MDEDEDEDDEGETRERGRGPASERGGGAAAASAVTAADPWSILEASRLPPIPCAPCTLARTDVVKCRSKLALCFECALSARRVHASTLH